MSASRLCTPILTVLMVIALAGCSDSDPVRGEFVAGCIHSGASKSDCFCIFNELEEKYSTEELDRLGKEYPPDEGLLKSTVAASLACRD